VFKALSLSAITAALLMTGGAALSQPAPAPASAGNATHGEMLLMQRCARCHTAGPYNGDSSAPDLDGVIGRAAGTRTDFEYSPAMKAYAMTWTPALLDPYLADPGVLVPGTLMRTRVAQAQDRADIIAYLATLKAQ
jgi:cytochrome c